jgi:hypothetical protein
MPRRSVVFLQKYLIFLPRGDVVLPTLSVTKLRVTELVQRDLRQKHDRANQIRTEISESYTQTFLKVTSDLLP